MNADRLPRQDDSNTDAENAGMYVPDSDSPLARMIAAENERHQRRLAARNRQD